MGSTDLNPEGERAKRYSSDIPPLQKTQGRGTLSRGDFSKTQRLGHPSPKIQRGFSRSGKKTAADQFPIFLRCFTKAEYFNLFKDPRVTTFLRADIAPSPDAVLSIDYIGKHYTNLRHQHLFEAAKPAVYWVNPNRPLGRFQFRLTTGLWVSGYKFIFAATDPDQ